jgi:hypothetical protein
MNALATNSFKVIVDVWIQDMFQIAEQQLVCTSALCSSSQSGPLRQWRLSSDLRKTHGSRAIVETAVSSAF